MRNTKGFTLRGKKMKRLSFMLALFIIVSVCVNGCSIEVEARKVSKVHEEEYFGC